MFAELQLSGELRLKLAGAVLTGACIALLGIMSDFGTAAIFFVTFLVIAYMRSGDFATLSLICGGAVFGAGIIMTFKP